MKTPIFLRVLYIVAVMVVGIAGYVIYDYHLNVLPRVPPPPVVHNYPDLSNDPHRKASLYGNPNAKVPTEADRWDEFTKNHDREHGRPALVYCTDPRKGTYCPN